MSDSTPSPAPHPARRIAFIIFAIGSIGVVLGVSVVKQRSWNEFTARAREQLARYPVVAERLGEITNITIDHDRRASVTNPNQVAMDLFGTLEVGTVQVEIVEGAHGYGLVFGDSLHVGDKSFPLVEALPPPVEDGSP